MEVEISVYGDNGGRLIINKLNNVNDLVQVEFGCEWCQGLFNVFIEDSELKCLTNILNKNSIKTNHEWSNMIGNISIRIASKSSSVKDMSLTLIPQMSEENSIVKFVIENFSTV